MKKDIELAGLGNALIDALVQIDDTELLEGEGLDRGTMHLVDHKRWDTLYQRLPAEQMVIRSGGSCANAVETFAQLGGTAAFCGQVGDDPMGALYKEKLQARLGGHHLHFIGGRHTGKCLSLVSRKDAERTMLTDLGCAAELESKNLFVEQIEGASFFHLTGYLFAGGAIGDTARRAIEVARAAGTRISFDLADPFVVDNCRPVVLEVARDYAELVFLNEEEAKRLAGSDDPLDAFRLLDRPGHIVIIKLGKRGSLVRAEGKLFPIEPVLVDAVDTTGAGDAYAGAFLYGARRGMDWGRCGRLASRVAAKVVSQLGAVVEDERELQDILRLI